MRGGTRGGDIHPYPCTHLQLEALRLQHVRHKCLQLLLEEPAVNRQSLLGW